MAGGMKSLLRIQRRIRALKHKDKVERMAFVNPSKTPRQTLGDRAENLYLQARLYLTGKQSNRELDADDIWRLSGRKKHFKKPK